MVGHNTANYPRGTSQSVYDRFRRWHKDGTIVEAAAGGVETVPPIAETVRGNYSQCRRHRRGIGTESQSEIVHKQVHSPIRQAL